MTTQKVQRPPTDLMRQLLTDIAAGRGGYHGGEGRSEYGGRHGTLAGLANRGLVDHRDELTAAGHEWVTQEQARQLRPETQ